MEYAGDTRTGLIRAVNQDSILALSKGEVSLFVVADGMGGHVEGEKASRAITENLRIWWRNIEENRYEQDFFKLVTSVRNYIEQANTYIYEKYNNNAVCGSTVSALLLYKKNYAIFQVGDTRIYKLEKRKLNQLTMDEVWENDIMTKKKFTEREIISSAKRGKLINAVGTTPELSITIKTDCLNEDALFLLCSDGLYKMIKPREVLKVLKKMNKSASVREGIDALMNSVYHAGAKDNVSIILVKTGETE